MNIKQVEMGGLGGWVWNSLNLLLLHVICKQCEWFNIKSWFFEQTTSMPTPHLGRLCWKLECITTILVCIVKLTVLSMTSYMFNLKFKHESSFIMEEFWESLCWHIKMWFKKCITAWGFIYLACIFNIFQDHPWILFLALFLQGKN